MYDQGSTPESSFSISLPPQGPFQKQSPPGIYSPFPVYSREPKCDDTPVNFEKVRFYQFARKKHALQHAKRMLQKAMKVQIQDNVVLKIALKRIAMHENLTFAVYHQWKVW